MRKDKSPGDGRRNRRKSTHVRIKPSAPPVSKEVSIDVPSSNDASDAEQYHDDVMNDVTEIVCLETFPLDKPIRESIRIRRESEDTLPSSKLSSESEEEHDRKSRASTSADRRQSMPRRSASMAKRNGFRRISMHPMPGDISMEYWESLQK